MKSPKQTKKLSGKKTTAKAFAEKKLRGMDRWDARLALDRSEQFCNNGDYFDGEHGCPSFYVLGFSVAIWNKLSSVERSKAITSMDRIMNLVDDNDNCTSKLCRLFGEGMELLGPARQREILKEMAYGQG